MSEVNFNPQIKQCIQENQQGNAEARSGIVQVAGSIWDTTSSIVGSVTDGVVGVAEGVADIAVGTVKAGAAIVKLPFTIGNALKTQEETPKAKADKKPDEAKAKKETESIYKLASIIARNKDGSLDTDSAKKLSKEDVIQMLAETNEAISSDKFNPAQKAAGWEKTEAKAEPKPCPKPEPKPEPTPIEPCDKFIEDPGNLFALD